MDTKIRVGLCGYGNLGKGVEKAIVYNPDMELKVIFTRRNPEEVAKLTTTPVVSVDEKDEWVDELDVVIMAGGSATDLPVQVPEFAGKFNTVDSFDTHADIKMLYEKVNVKAFMGKKCSIISTGWDPGMFSLMRAYFKTILPNGEDYTFWGPGLSQGHSDAIRRIEGVKKAAQYTIPIVNAMDRVRNGETPKFTPREKHNRECFVVVEDGADESKIEAEIKNMPKYFADYDTEVHFISEEEFDKQHTDMPHGGNVIRVGKTGEGNKQEIEFSLKLSSNPEFTGSVLLAFARGAYNMSKVQGYGAKTVLDIPPRMLMPETYDELFKLI